MPIAVQVFAIMVVAREFREIYKPVIKSVAPAFAATVVAREFR